MPFLAAIGPALAAFGGGSLGTGIASASAIGGNIAGGALRGRGRRTSSQASGSFNEDSSGTRRQVFSPEQIQILSALAPQILGLLNDPAAGLQPLRVAARQGVNNQFAGADQQIRNRFLSSGAQRSGKANRSALATDLFRRGALGGVETEFAKLQLQRQDLGSQLALKLLGMPFEQSTTSTTRRTTDQRSRGRTSGNAVGGALDAGVQSAGTLLEIARQLRGSDSPDPMIAVDPAVTASGLPVGVRDKRAG